ncbi:MAG TPA: xanthine dehydrogenase family protein subunit M [Proteobacteria bacterium]|mgnify:CR=1 FL=1|nr:FAD binding domain-containing protein [Deltaproteobacteria bacterium]HDS16333.1 xanthine dehydrogenase family protein subunit M [Pseudomonadota bacterium]
MTLPKFNFLAPTTLAEACALLEKHQGRIKLKAGGTDMLVRLSHRAVKPDYLLSIKQLPGLNEISHDQENGLTIGALALLRQVESHPLILEKAPMVARAAHATATVQIRNMGTVMGNLCNASPSADNIPTLMAMNASITTVSGKGAREIPLDEFFLGPGRTALAADEIATAIKVPAASLQNGVSYQKISPRSKVDIAAVNIGAMIALDAEKRCREVRIVMGAVGPTPLHAMQAEAFLPGKFLNEETLAEAGRLAAEDAAPISDVRASREYRKLMVEVLTKRALLEAAGLA